MKITKLNKAEIKNAASDVYGEIMALKDLSEKARCISDEIVQDYFTEYLDKSFKSEEDRNSAIVYDFGRNSIKADIVYDYVRQLNEKIESLNEKFKSIQEYIYAEYKEAV